MVQSTRALQDRYDVLYVFPVLISTSSTNDKIKDMFSYCKSSILIPSYDPSMHQRAITSDTLRMYGHNYSTGGGAVGRSNYTKAKANATFS
jgi:hypothetical protein